jgi:diguanylate cyclase (GGDEF)-like protein
MPKTVLVVDDSVLLHKLIKTYLEPDDVAIHSARDGEEGLSAAETLNPGLILLDVDMPRLDGFEVCRRLKANPITARIPIIFLTACAVLDNRVRGLDLGAADFIAKPFKPNELRARVRASLRAKGQMESISLVDLPTGLWNRAYLEGHLELHVASARRFGTSLSCIIIEIACAVASEDMRWVAQILASRCRTDDVVCRFDQSKFAILSNGANRAAAALIADRLCHEVHRRLRVQKGRKTPITSTFGVADTRISSAVTLLERANAALLIARTPDLIAI